MYMHCIADIVLTKLNFDKVSIGDWFTILPSLVELARVDRWGVVQLIDVDGPS